MSDFARQLTVVREVGAPTISEADLAAILDRMPISPAQRDRVERLAAMRRRGDVGRLPEEVPGQPFRPGRPSAELAIVVDGAAVFVHRRLQPAKDGSDRYVTGPFVVAAPFDQGAAAHVQSVVLARFDQVSDHLVGGGELHSKDFDLGHLTLRVREQATEARVVGPTQ